MEFISSIIKLINHRTRRSHPIYANLISIKISSTLFPKKLKLSLNRKILEVFLSKVLILTNSIS